MRNSIRDDHHWTKLVENSKRQWIVDRIANEKGLWRRVRNGKSVPIRLLTKNEINNYIITHVYTFKLLFNFIKTIIGRY